MPSTAPWARYDPRIRLVISGTAVPCIRCSVDYEMNAIPQASATLAVGRGFDGKPSPVHALSGNFVDRAPVQIYINPNATGQDPQSARGPGDLGLSGGEVRIFDGFVTAAGFTRSRGSAQFNIQMEHWLSEMGFSSIFSKTSHPANPGHYSFGALAPTDKGGGNFANLGLAYDYVKSETITNDFWGEALKPFLTTLCSQDAFWAYDQYITVTGANDGALAALKRFNSKWQPKLGLDMTADADIAQNIMQQVGDTVGLPGQLAHQTVWDVLVGTFASEYLFYVIPRVEDALVVPFIPGYRTAFTTITADDETQVEWIRGLGRPLRGVGILSGTKSDSGATMTGQGAPAELVMGGFYSPNPDAKTGMIVIKQGPEWMSKLYAPSLYSAASTGALGNAGAAAAIGGPVGGIIGAIAGGAIGNAVQPGGKAVNNVTNDIAARLKNIVRPFLDKYAHALYVLEKLRPRQAVCSGPFRLDIAPGSTVKVQNEGEQYIGGDPLAAPFYAHVVRVTLGIDGEQPSIGTSFHLSHIRSVQENTQDSTSIAKHPLYKASFAGCPLVDTPTSKKKAATPTATTDTTTPAAVTAVGGAAAAGGQL